MENLESTTETTEGVESSSVDTTDTAATEAPATTNSAGQAEDTSIESKALADAQKELARRTNALKNLQAENAKLKEKRESVKDEEEPVQAGSTGQTTDDTYNHPALKGLTVGVDGDVLYKGGWVTPSFAIEQYELTKSLSEMNEWRSQIENRFSAEARAREEAEYNAKIQTAQKELFSVVETTITAMREEAFPALQKEHAGEVDEYLLVQADNILTKSLGNGEELTSELIEKAAKDALGKAKRLFGVLGLQQMKDNTEYRQNNPIRPGGVAGTPAPERPKNLSPSQKDRINRKAAEEAMKESGFTQ